MSDLPVAAAARPAAAEIELPLVGLAAGEYVVELNAEAEGRHRAGTGRLQSRSVATAEESHVRSRVMRAL